MVTYVESMVHKNIPAELRDQYTFRNNQVLSNLLLSPRAHVQNNNYMPCRVCYNNIKTFVKKNHKAFPLAMDGLLGMYLIGIFL